MWADFRRRTQHAVQKTMQGTKSTKRKIPFHDGELFPSLPISQGLLSPLKSLKLSPIPRNENSRWLGNDDHLLDDKENLGSLQCMNSYVTATANSVDGDSGGIGTIEVLEIFEKDMVNCRGKQKMYQAYKGQVKLSVYVNYGLLTIHVMQARHLNCKHKDTCDTFVKLSLAPDESRRTRCKTEVIYDTNHPVFDEKFSFELLEEDLKKRLLISVWNRNSKRDRSEFLGCMSFGIQHINSQKRVINGWYYLLNEEVGRSKHLQVSSKKPLLKEVSHKNIPKVNQDVLWMEPHVLLIRRGPLGYGFSLTGCSPVRICSVMPGSFAEEAGLLKDDCVVRVNGMNVSRSSADSIARIVRHSSHKIILEVQRPRNVDTSVQQRSQRKPLSSTLRNHHHHHPDSGAHSDSELEENVRNKLTIGHMCGSLPRKRVTFKDNAC